MTTKIIKNVFLVGTTLALFSFDLPKGWFKAGSEDASNLAYDAPLSGTGQIWFDNITLEIVDNSVPSTNLYGSKKQSPQLPVTLNFEE